MSPRPGPPPIGTVRPEKEMPLPCKPDSVRPLRSATAISLTPLARDAPLARSATNTRGLLRAGTLPLFCLAPRGVFRAASVTFGAVGSYPTISPLPVPLRAVGGMLSAALSVRVPRGSRPSLSRGALPCGVRTFLDRHSRADRSRPGSGNAEHAAVQRCRPRKSRVALVVSSPTAPEIRGTAVEPEPPAFKKICRKVLTRGAAGR
jgi:hypothetical protein